VRDVALLKLRWGATALLRIVQHQARKKLMSQTVFCVCGRKGSGKDTLLATLSSGDTNGSYLVVKLSDTLKDGVSSFYGWDRSRLDGSTEEDRKWREEVDVFWTKALGREVTPRSELQRVGTEGMRVVAGQDFWVHSMLKRLLSREDMDKRVVFVGDCRFLNEIEVLSRIYSARIIYIERERDESLPYFAYMRDTLRGGELSELSELSEDKMDKICSYMRQVHPDVHRSEWECLLISLVWGSSDKFRRVQNFSSLEDYKRNLLDLKVELQ